MVPDLVNKYLKMWLWILISLEIITKLHGYSDGRFPESCDSMLPVHIHKNGILFEPQRTDPPFEITYDPAPHGQPITVYLKSKQSNKFIGFMLEARMTTEFVGPAVGKFIVLDYGETKLLSCHSSPDNAVSQRHTSEKRLFRVNWMAPAQEENLDYTFRATFVESFDTFWERVDLVVKLSAPSPTTTTSTPSTILPTTTTPTTTSTTTPITTTPTTTSTTTPITTTPTTTSTTTPINTSTKTPIATKPTSGSTMPSSTSTNEPDTTEPLNLTKLQEPGTVLVIANSVLVSVKTVKILSCVLCAAVEIPALVLFSLADPINVLFIALVCVAIAFNFMELFLVCLRIEPSHELKEISELTIKVCSVIHCIFTTAIIFLGVMEFDNCGKEREDSWLVKVMMACTVWILLFVIWVYVGSIHRKTILGGSKIVSSKNRN